MSPTSKPAQWLLHLKWIIPSSNPLNLLLSFGHYDYKLHTHIQSNSCWMTHPSHTYLFNIAKVFGEWPRGFRHGCGAACLLGLWVRIPPGAWISVPCVCCMLSGRGLCVGLITRPEYSYRVWCVWVQSWILDNG